MDSCYSFQNATGLDINDLIDTSQINQGIIDSSNNNYIYSFNNSNLNFAYTSNSSNILYLNTSNSSNDFFISLTSNLSNLNSSGSNTSNYTFGYLDSNLLWTQAELFKLQVEHALQKAQLTAMSLTDSLMQASISTQSITLLDHGSQLNTLNDKIDDYIQYTDNASNVLSNLNSNTSNSLHSLNRNTSNDCIVYTNDRSNLTFNNYSNSVFTSSNNNIYFTSNLSNSLYSLNRNTSNDCIVYTNARSNLIYNNYSNSVFTSSNNNIYITSNTSNSLFKLNSNTSNDCIVYTNARSNLIFNNYSNSVFTSSNNNIIFTSNTSNTIFENASNADYIYKNNDVNFNCNVFIGPNASLIMNYNNPGSYYQNNGYSSFFNLSSTLSTYSGTDVQPFITNYNRLYRLNTNTALKLITYGNALTGQNSSTYILMDSGGENGTTSIPNIGTISFNISSTITGGNTDRFVITPSASVFNNNVGIGIQTPAYKLDVSGNFNASGHININGMNISNIFTTSNVLSNTSNDCIAFAGNYDNIIYNKPFTRLGTLLYNDTACYIGIGKNNPTSLFEINTRHLDYFPIAWYKFNDAGNVGFDSIGTYHLTQNNVSTPVLSDSDSVEGAYSAKFNSLGRYLKISNNYGLNGGNFTICFWVKRLYVDRDDELFQICLVSKSAQKLIISYQSDNRISFNLIGKNVITPNTYLDQYTWVHLAFVYTNDFNVKIYRNSHLVHSDTTITTATNFSASSTMGFTLQDGLIDDFRIFNVALSAYDIFSIFYYFNDNNGLSLNSSYLNKTYKLNILPYDIANQRIGYKFRIVDNQTAPYNKDVIYI